MRDRDTSFALQTVLYYSLKNDDSIKDIDFLIPWLEPHSEIMMYREHTHGWQVFWQMLTPNK
ncbi:MAG: hypothetical protein ACLUKE_00700 [Blautia wexlerae]